MNDATAATLRIDMVSDIVCPWCTIGYQKLLKAMSELQKTRPELTIDVHFQPFELNPQMPPEGQNVNEHIAEKYGADEHTIADNRAKIKAVALELGLEFNSSDQSRIYNTFNAHKLLHEADTIGLQRVLKLALFEAYFTRQLDISDSEVLVTIATDVGMAEDRARAVLADEQLSAEVRGQLQTFIRAGVSSVPTFIFNQRYSVNGAQEPELLQQMMEQVLQSAD
jgi:predicted DsbA family dithiol-disulfide isomerase